MFDSTDYSSEYEWEQDDDRSYRAYELYEDGQMDLALQELNEAIEANPTDSSLYFNKALTLDTMERYSEAIDCYKIALEDNPHDPEIYNSLAIDYTRTGYYDLAIETFKQAHEIDPEFEPAFCNRIITYTEMGKYDKAEEMFYLAQQIEPDCPLCFYNIGNSLFSQGEMKRAAWCWEKTKSIQPTHPQINYRIAQAYWAMSQNGRANDYFLAELRNDPGNIEAILDYALFLLQIKNIESGREKLNRIIELQPDFAIAHHYLGEIELNAGNIEKAEELFKLAMEYDDFAGPGFRLAQCLLLSGNNEDALELLKRELEFEIHDFDVLMSMGTLFLQLKEYDFATNCFIKSTDEDPTSYLPFYFIGKSMYKSGDQLDAIHFFSYAIELREDHQPSYAMLAKCYLHGNQFEKAAEITQAGLEIDTQNSDLKILSRQIRSEALKSKAKGKLAIAIDVLKDLFKRN